MRLKTSWLGISAAVLVLAGCGGGGVDNLTPVNAGGVTRVVTFGDSLSDPGAYQLVAADKNGGRFTVNGPDSRVWTELVARDYGLPLRPNQVVTDAGPLRNPDGTSYAEGGSRVTIVFDPQTGQPVSGLERNLITDFVPPTGYGIKTDANPCQPNGTSIFTVGNNVFGNTYRDISSSPGATAQQIAATASLSGCIVNPTGPAETVLDQQLPIQNAGSGFLIEPGGSTIELETGASKKRIEPRNATRTGLTTLPISVQVDRFLAGAADDRNKANTLIIIQGGANDFFALANALTEQTFNPRDQLKVAGFLQTTAGALAAQIIRLQTIGYTKILYSDLPNVGDTPFAQSQGPEAVGLFNQLTAGFNATLDGALAQLGADPTKVRKVSSNELLQDILNNNSKPQYGFRTLLNGTACKSTMTTSRRFPLRLSDQSLFCNSQNQDDLNDPSLNPSEDYVFADGVHPSPKVHRLFAEKALGVLRAAGWR